MMKKILILFFLLTAAAAVFAFDFYTPESIEQGGVITLLIEDGYTGSDIEAGLSDGNDVFSKSSFFNTEISGYKVDISLLGVPSTLSPGIYSVFAVDDSGERVSKDIIVNSKVFINEDIALSRTMSSLRQSDDIRKAEQWRNMLAILKTVDREHIFEEGMLDLPVKDYLRTSSFYGDRRQFLYDDGESARSVHNGIDYSAEPGTPIYAAGRGRVVFSGERILTGNTIVIEHLPGVYSLYYHMNSLNASEGDMLEAGGMLGTVGATGLVTGAHLHWEIRVAGVAVDPEPLMKASIIDKAFILSTINEQ